MITETINYNIKKSLKRIYSDTESLEFVFDTKYPSFSVEYMGLNISSMFLSEVEIRHFTKMIYTNNNIVEIFSPTYTNNQLTGLISNNRSISFVYNNSMIVSFKETAGSVIREWVYTRDDEDKLMNIRITTNIVSDDFKDILYSDNDTIIGYNDRLKYNLFKFDIFGVTSFESEGITYMVEYE